MNIVKSCGLVAAGLVAGVMLVISCSDDSPGTADAASCDCPPAEPPVAERIEIVTATQTIPANSNGGQSTGCPVGAALLSGGCDTDNGQPADIQLRMSTPFDGDLRGWSCWFRNNENVPVTIKVSAVCLVSNSSNS